MFALRPCLLWSVLGFVLCEGTGLIESTDVDEVFLVVVNSAGGFTTKLLFNRLNILPITESLSCSVACSKLKEVKVWGDLLSAGCCTLIRLAIRRKSWLESPVPDYINSNLMYQHASWTALLSFVLNVPDMAT